MTDAIIVALITGVVAIVGQLIISNKQSHDLYNRLDKQFSLQDKELEGKLERWKETTDLRIEALTTEVRKHNGFAEKIPVIEEKIKVGNARILDLEKKVG